MLLLSKGGLEVKAQQMHLSVLQRGLCSVWASRNASRNRRVGNYCENCAQEEVKPTDSPRSFYCQPFRVLLGDSLVVSDLSAL